MRTRRRPVLQDKTPGNTPQKPKPKATRAAKPDLVPVVEIKARVRRSKRGRDVKVDEPADVDDVAPAAVPQEEARLASGPAETGVNHDAPPPKRGRGRPRKVVPKIPTGPPPALSPVKRVSLPVAGDTGSDRHSPEEDVDENAPPVPSPVSPTLERQAARPRIPRATRHVPLGSLPPSSFPVSVRPSSPESIPIADDDSTTSEAAKALLLTPSPARIVRAPIPVESTPLGRLPTLEASLRPAERGRHPTSIRKWNLDVSRTYSPLPPSSPPVHSPPPTQVPVATSSQARYQAEFSDQPHENQPAHGPVYVKRDTPPSDDDLFGLLAAEKKLKTIRQRRTATESSRAPGGTRAPLGTLALDEVPSVPVAIPDRLPTPIPSDDDHNIDDLYLDVDPIRPGPSHLEDSDELEDEDKENVPTDDYDLNDDKENMRPPHIVLDELPESDAPGEGSSSEVDDMIDETENSIAPILLASARKTGLDQLLESPSSSSGSPTHALRTPHKHRSAHHRSPLPTPHFSDGGLSDDLGVGGSNVRDESPSPVKKPSAVRAAATRGRAVVVQGKGKGKEKEKAGPSKPRVPLATLEYEDPYAEPAKVAGQKRTRGSAKDKGKEKEKEKSSEEDSDPKAAVRRLEALLPKRPKKKARVAEASGSRAGKEREVVRKGKGKGRANESESGDEDDDDGMGSDSSPPTPPVRAARGRGRGRGRGSGTGRGRGRGRAGAPATNGRTAAAAKPASRGRSTSRGRPPASKDKGKKRAIEEVDPDEDEERARKRQERIEYFKKLQEYSLEKEDVYVI